MTNVSDLVAHFRKLIEQISAELADMEAGRIALRENKGSGWHDITQSWIGEQKARIANLERIVGGYERKRET